MGHLLYQGVASVIPDFVSSWQLGQGVLSLNPCPNSFWSLPAAALPQRKNHLCPLPLAQGTICTMWLPAPPHTHTAGSWACEPSGVSPSILLLSFLTSCCLSGQRGDVVEPGLQMRAKRVRPMSRGLLDSHWVCRGTDAGK